MISLDYDLEMLFWYFNVQRRLVRLQVQLGHAMTKYRWSPLFVDVVTRVATTHASPIECSTHFPLYIETEQRGWVTISDVVRPVDAPATKHLLRQSLEHESFAGKGLYTEEELRSWVTFAGWGTFHDSVMTRVAQGVCQTERGPCTQQMAGAVPYDLNKLVTLAENANPVHVFNEWVKQNVGYLCMAVLIFWAIQALVVMVMVLYALCRDGLGAGMATLYVALCVGPHLMSKVRRSKSRRPFRANAPDDTELQPMK